MRWAELTDYPTILELAIPRVRAYPRETVVAEKYEAIVKLGQLNSRMKDFFDLRMLAKAVTRGIRKTSPKTIRATAGHGTTAATTPSLSSAAKKPSKNTSPKPPPPARKVR